MKFKAAIFDFDGTITEKGHILPSKKMADALYKLARKMPIAICTGRQLESFESYGLSTLIKDIPHSKLDAFFENLYLITENGAIGFEYNTDLDRFEEFYKAVWPENFIKKEEFKKILEKEIREYGSLYKAIKYPSHKVTVVLQTKLHLIPPKKRDINEVYQLSHKMYEKTVEVLKKFDSHYEKYLHVGDSGIGVVICPASYDKDTAVKKFAGILKKKRGIVFGKKLREILIVGDRPEKSGNDYYLLKGDYGTCYTVGSLGVKKNSPKPVINKKGKRLFHSKGLYYLIKSNLI